MKNQIKYLILSFFIVSVLSVSCSEDPISQNYNETSLKSGKPDDIPSSYTFTTIVNGETITGEIVMEWNYEVERPNSVTVSSNILDALGISQQEFQSQYQIETDDDDDPNEGLSPHTLCIETCKDKYTDENGDKIKGRGACKANCWVDTAIRLVEVIAEAVS